jgi:hypothetical protein
MMRHLCSALGADALKSIGGLAGQYRVLQSVQHMLQHSLTQEYTVMLSVFYTWSRRSEEHWRPRWPALGPAVRATHAAAQPNTESLM